MIEYDIDENGCHNCISHATDRDGYVIVFRNKKPRRLHRFVYEEKYNVVLKENEVVRHLCHNRRCINIDHLAIGSQNDNIQDSVKAKRNVRGTKVSTAKLNPDDVLHILQSKERIDVLKEKLHVSRVTISRIKNRKSWKHIEDTVTQNNQ